MARGESVKVRKCRFYTADVDRVEHLVERVIIYSLRINPASKKTPRSAVLRALLQLGLRLADTREIPLESPVEKSPLVLLSYRVSDEETTQLERLCKKLVERSPFGAEPELAEVERRIVRLALDEVQTRASFPAFMLLVWAASRFSSGNPDPIKSSA